MINWFKKFKYIKGIENLKKYNIDWQNKYFGNSEFCLLPNSTEEISEILKICNKNNIKLKIQGGNTNLVGGATPLDNEVVLSTEKLNNYYFEDNLLKVDCGAILEKVNDYLINNHKRILSYNLGAKGSCTIGGNIATNAGGINFINNGYLKDYVKALEVVLPTGEIMNISSYNKKDNSVFDFKHLFIGTEGNFGIITKIELETVKFKHIKQLHLVKLDSFSKVIKLLDIFNSKYKQYLNAFEYIDKVCINTVEEIFNFSEGKYFNLNGDEFYYALIELEFDNDKDNQYILNQILEEFKDYEDWMLCQNDQQKDIIWKTRENIVTSFKEKGLNLKFDLSLNSKDMKKFYDYIKPKIINKIIDMGAYGHIGDGNLHLNILIEDEKYTNDIDKIVYKSIKEFNGCISAEHGIGKMKSEFLKYQKSELEINYIKKMKKLFDPNNIINNIYF